MSQTKSDINIDMVFTVMIAASTLLLVIIVGAHALILYQERGEVAAKWEEMRYAPLEDLLANQRAWLNHPPRATAPTTRPAPIPIHEAMKVVVQTGGNVVFPMEQ